MVERTSTRGPAHRLSSFVDAGSPLTTLQHDLNTVLADFWRSNGLTVGDPTGTPGTMCPRVDVSENADTFRLSADLPGLDAKSVKVSVENDSTVVLEGGHAEEHDEHGRNWIRRERGSGAFRRAIDLPVTIDAARVTAAFAKGVLTVEAPKSRDAVAKRRSVEVKSA